MGWVFSVCGKSMTVIPYFGYLGQTLLSSDDNWVEVEQNIRRSLGNGYEWRIFLEGGYRIGEQWGGLCCRGVCGASIWVQDMGNDHPVGEIP